MNGMRAKKSDSLSLEFGQGFHGKYWNNECEICSVFQQLVSQWSHCSNIFFQINLEPCEREPLAPIVSPGSPKCIGQVDSPLRKLHGAEKKQNVSGILKAANSSQIRQKIILGSQLSFSTAKSEGRWPYLDFLAWLNAAQHWAPQGSWVMESSLNVVPPATSHTCYPGGQKSG